MALPIQTYLNIARICQYMAADGNSKKLLFQGGGNRADQSFLLYVTRNIIQWAYDLNPDDPTIPRMALYMYSLCNPYIAAAQRILGQGQAGQIINPSTGTTVTITNPALQFRIGEPGALMTVGETVLTLTGYENVINPSVEIFLDGVELPYGVSESISYTVSYNNDDAEIVITFSQPVQTFQLYRIRFIQLINVGIPASLGEQTLFGGIFTGNL
jgi:hypothetical protein